MTKCRIYTGGGDSGKTSLVGGKRVDKTDCRVNAYGSIDELNANLGLLLAQIDDMAHKEQDSAHKIQFATLTEQLVWIENRLFCIGCELATPAGGKSPVTIQPDCNTVIEGYIDAIDLQLPALNSFVLPGGTVAAAQAGVARSVCRRAEREILRLNGSEPVDSAILVFMNRLSDYLFVLSRLLNVVTGTQELFWNK